MKYYSILRLILIGLIILSSLPECINAQSTSFDLNAYKQFLSDHQNLTTQQLFELHPAGTFRGKIPSTASGILYLDSIYQKYNLTNQEKSLLNDHGFVVTERLSHNSFGEAFIDIWHKDLPVFVSTDAILHALHMSYDRILMDVERSVLILRLDSLLGLLHSQMPVLTANYASHPEMTTMLRDVDIYISIPRILLGSISDPFYAENRGTIDELLNLIQSEKPADYPLFAKTKRTIDFSQFKVRGHYTNELFPILAKYFKAMMWFGRTEFYLIEPQNVDQLPIPIEDIQRQVIDAELIREAVQLAGALPVLEEIDNIIRFFVGESDNVTLTNFGQLVTAMEITSAEPFLDTNKVKEFQDTLITKSYAFQRILSQILMADDLDPDSIIPASAFMLLGQRFIIDSYITGQVVYDRIKYNGDKIRRMLPSTLDVLFAIGNDASAQLLKNELDQYKYGSNLATLRYLVQHYEPEFWNSTLFNLWLNAIRSLNPPANRDSLPGFMQTAAWWQAKMNTQLASWAELRHDNLLYAKQSYTGGAECAYPYSYVEPNPAFFDAMKTFADIAKNKFQAITFSDSYTQSNIINYFTVLYTIMDTLGTISNKELAMTVLTESENNFLKKMIANEFGCVTTYGGWFPKLFYGEDGQGGVFCKKDYLVADIHTAPTDAGGDMVGWVLHAGTGKVNNGVFIATVPGGQTIAFTGPVSSYHEYLSTNFLRLSDEEWHSSYFLKSSRPSFVNIYLTDSLGNELPMGTNLFTSVDEKFTPQLPKAIVLHHNFPNPFNSTTVISFSIPTSLTNSAAELTIYNIQGQIVKILLKESLPSGNYMTRWDGTNERGKSVTSGVYFYRLKVGANLSTGKLSYIK